MRTPSDIPNTNPASPTYAHGQLKDDQVPGDSTGTPVRADWLSDIYYGQLEVIDRAGIVVNHAAETSITNNFADAVDTLIGNAVAPKENSANKGVANGYAPLDASAMVPVANLPATVITDTFEVASEVAMLALSAQQGDIAIRSDISKTFVLGMAPASTLSNWKELKTPTDVVQSVNGKTGTVIIGTADISGLDTNLTTLNTFRDWGSTQTYDINDPVFYAGLPYRSLTAGNINKLPTSNPTDWEYTGPSTGATNPIITANYTASTQDATIFVNTASAITITIPAGLPVGKVLSIYRIVAGSDITIAKTGSDTIDGGVSSTFYTNISSTSVQVTKTTSTGWATSGDIGFFLSNTEAVVNTNGVTSKTTNAVDGVALLSNTAVTFYDMTLPRALRQGESVALEVKSKINGNWVNVELAGVTTMGILSLNSVNYYASNNTVTRTGMSPAFAVSGQIRVIMYNAAQVTVSGGDISSPIGRTWANVTGASDGYDRWRLRIK